MPTIPCQNILNPNDHVEPDWLLPSQPERHEHWLAAVQGRCPQAAPLARRLLSELTRQDGVHITLTPGVASQLGPELIDVEVQMQDLFKVGLIGHAPRFVLSSQVTLIHTDH